MTNSVSTETEFVRTEKVLLLGSGGRQGESFLVSRNKAPGEAGRFGEDFFALL